MGTTFKVKNKLYNPNPKKSCTRYHTPILYPLTPSKGKMKISRHLPTPPTSKNLLPTQAILIDLLMNGTIQHKCKIV